MEKLIILLIALIAWLWHDSLKAREMGIAAVRRACEQDGLQLLDETISLASLKPDRDEHGRLKLRRVYQFEYSDTGDNRRQGSVHILGSKVVMVNVGLRLAAVNGRLL